MGKYSSFCGMVAWGRGRDKVEGAGVTLLQLPKVAAISGYLRDSR